MDNLTIKVFSILSIKLEFYVIRTNDGDIYQSVVKEGKGAAVSRLSASILLIIPITRPYSLWNLRNYLEMRKLQLRVKQIRRSPEHYIKLYKQQNKLWKTVRLTTFRKPTIAVSVSIYFKFIHPLLHLCFLFSFHSVWWQFPPFHEFW